jgi:hypothetical protein
LDEVLAEKKEGGVIQTIYVNQDPKYKIRLGNAEIRIPDTIKKLQQLGANLWKGIGEDMNESDIEILNYENENEADARRTVKIRLRIKMRKILSFLPVKNSLVLFASYLLREMLLSLLHKLFRKKSKIL